MMKKTTLIKWLAPLFMIMHIHATTTANDSREFIVKLTEKYTEEAGNLLDLSKNKEVQQIMTDEDATAQEVLNSITVEARKVFLTNLKDKNKNNKKFQNIEVENIRLFCHLDSTFKVFIGNFQYNKMTYKEFIETEYPGDEQSGNEGQNVLTLVFYIPGLSGNKDEEKILVKQAGKYFEITPESIKTRTEKEYQEIKESADDFSNKFNSKEQELTKAQNELKKLYTFMSVVIALCIGLLIGLLVEGKTAFLGQWLFGSATDDDDAIMVYGDDDEDEDF